jgi:hypothetical protein
LAGVFVAESNFATYGSHITRLAYREIAHSDCKISSIEDLIGAMDQHSVDFVRILEIHCKETMRRTRGARFQKKGGKGDDCGMDLCIKNKNRIICLHENFRSLQPS